MWFMAMPEPENIADNKITVEVIYALAGQQFLKKLHLVQGSTAIDAIYSSRVIEVFPEINFKKNKIGIFGCFVKSDTLLKDGDRVEIYRSLIIDPKETRRKRAAKK